MSDDKQMAYVRAKEVLSDAGWVFDHYRGAQLEVMLSEAPLEDREKAYTRARASMEMQSGLLSVVESYELKAKQLEEKAKLEALSPDERRALMGQRREERAARKAEVKQKQEERRRGRT